MKDRLHKPSHVEPHAPSSPVKQTSFTFIHESVWALGDRVFAGWYVWTFGWVPRLLAMWGGWPMGASQVFMGWLP